MEVMMIIDPRNSRINLVMECDDFIDLPRTFIFNESIITTKIRKTHCKDDLTIANQRNEYVDIIDKPGKELPKTKTENNF